LADAIGSVERKGSRVVFLSPQGKPFRAATARRLSKVKRLILVCGHYEGVDERARCLFDEELSIGDYVLTGGELPALVVADAVVRLLPGALKKEEAVLKESFASGLLDFPQYTRPRVWRRKAVPEALFCGDHGRVERWRAQAALAATRRKRPDLLSPLIFSRASARPGD
ncbi:MAG: tRNA (guanosine(37)-N1)-methyltransferase TrmD, partial [Elusimicrobia bacterium]|nr:tRNA (guanosine(37)-N1)-methyltransferase TrmD [Elusimicrobiota bacterium]